MRRASRRWPSALAFVASLHLLTLPLTWIVTDQSEMIVMSKRLLRTGSLTLAADGARPVPEAPWIPHRAGRPVRSRLFPGTSVVLLPLVALDAALGLDGPPHLGRLAHLQGFACMIATLALLGGAAARLGASDAGIVVAIGVLGTTWPVWMISRNGGAEPVVALLLMAFVATRLLQGAGAVRGPLLGAQAALLATLPWVHPTGAVLALALAAAGWLPGVEPRRRTLALGASAAFGCAGVLLWNVAYHGHWLIGGYAQVGGERFFGATAALTGLAVMARDGLLQAPIAIALVALVARAHGRAAWPWLREPLIVTLSLLALFATYYEHDTPRRLSVAWPLLGVPIALGWRGLRWPDAAGRLAIAASLAVGLYWFEAAMGSYYETAGGVPLPGVFWAELAVAHGWSVIWMLPVALLLGALVWSFHRSFGPPEERRAE